MSHHLEESLLSVRIAEKGSEQKLVWPDGTNLDKYHCQTFFNHYNELDYTKSNISSEEVLKIQDYMTKRMWKFKLHKLLNYLYWPILVAIMIYFILYVFGRTPFSHA